MSNTLAYRNALSDQQTLIKFTYTNWKGMTAERTVQPLCIEFGTTPEHPEPCWMLRSVCQDKKAQRNFMMSKMQNVQEVVQ